MPGLPDECAQLTHETVGRATFSFPSPLPHPCPTAIELRRNGFFPILIVILLLISKNLSRARLRLGLRLRACQCGPAAGLNSMAVHPGPLPGGEGEPFSARRTIQRGRFSTARSSLFPLPTGEGQGEGKRREVPSPGLDQSRNRRTTSPPAKPEGSRDDSDLITHERNSRK